MRLVLFQVDLMNLETDMDMVRCDRCCSLEWNELRYRLKTLFRSIFSF